MAPVEILKRNAHVTVHPYDQQVAPLPEQPPVKGADASNDPISKLSPKQLNEINRFWHHYKRELMVDSIDTPELAQRDARQVVHNGETPFHLNANPINVLPPSREPALIAPTGDGSGNRLWRPVYKRQESSAAANEAGSLEDELDIEEKHSTLGAREVIYPGQGRSGRSYLPISTHYGPKSGPLDRHGQSFGLQRKVLAARDEPLETRSVHQQQSLLNHGPLVLLAAIIAVVPGTGS